MTPLILFIYGLVNWVLDALCFCIIAGAVLSWLVAFNIVNPRNNFVYQILRFFDAVTTPVLAPFRRFIPLIGGIDITPVIALVVIRLVQSTLLRPAFAALANLLGGAS